MIRVSAVVEAGAFDIINPLSSGKTQGLDGNLADTTPRRGLQELFSYHQQLNHRVSHYCHKDVKLINYG